MVGQAEDFNPLNELLKVVNRLTVLQTSAIWQGEDDERRAVKVVQHGLIRLLREAITSNIGGTESGGTLPNQRNILDSDALQKYDALEIAILRAYKGVTSAVPYLTPEQNLRQTFLGIANAYRSGRMAEDALVEHVAVWGGWCRTIEDKLWPPSMFDLVAVCPVEGCGVSEVLNADGERMVALVVESRPAVNGGLSASLARCRACQMVWRGQARLEFLAESISDVVVAA
jgi:hypothetical protein